MKEAIKILIITMVFTFLLNGCFSSGDIEYDDYYYYENEIVIVEHPSPVVIVTPVEPIVEQPKKKRRTGGELYRGSGRKRINPSYRHRDNHKSSPLRSGYTSGNHNRSKIEKRIRNRK
jgi:hypothetical protein